MPYRGNYGFFFKFSFQIHVNNESNSGARGPGTPDKNLPKHVPYRGNYGICLFFCLNCSFQIHTNNESNSGALGLGTPDKNLPRHMPCRGNYRVFFFCFQFFSSAFCSKSVNFECPGGPKPLKMDLPGSILSGSGAPGSLGGTKVARGRSQRHLVAPSGDPKPWKNVGKTRFFEKTEKNDDFEFNARTSVNRASHAGKTAIFSIFGCRKIRPNQFSKQRKLSSRVGESSIYNIFEKMK